MDNNYGDWRCVAGVELEVTPDDGQTTVYTPWNGNAKKTFTITGTRLSGGSESATLTVLQEMANYVKFDGYEFESNFDRKSGAPKGILTMYFKHGSAISFSGGRVSRFWCKYTADMGNWRSQTFSGNEHVTLYGPTTEWEWVTDTSKTYSQSCPWSVGESGGRGYIKFTDFQYLYRSNLDNQHSYMYGGRLTLVFQFKDENKENDIAWCPITITQKIGEESTWNIKTTVIDDFR
jgi:hypothetical protein